jgi:hypothetical protein
MAQRRGTAAQWTTANTVLLAGEIGFETDTGYFKIGDGTTAWNTLLYANPKFDSLGISTGSPAGLTHSLTGDVSTTGTSTALSLSSGFDLAPGYDLLNSNSDQTIYGNKVFSGGVVAQSLKSSFASATARDAAITSPTEGMICYLEDVNQVTSYLGSAWFPIAGQMPFFDVQKSATQTGVASSTITTVTWPTATTNRGGFTVASNQVTVPIAGIYMINAAVTFDSGNTAGNNRHILIHVNGSAVTRDYGFPGITVDSALRSTITLLLAAGDVVDVRVFQTSGSNMTLQISRTRLTISYQGP